MAVVVLVLSMIFTVIKSFHDELIDSEYMIGRPTPLVINGTKVSIAEFPSAARFYNIFYNYRSTCGAVILTRRILVTAAHCFNINKDPSKMHVVVGKTHFRKGDFKRLPKHFKYEVCAIVQHEEYFPHTVQGKDIALILLSRRLENRKKVRKGYIARNEDFLSDFEKDVFVVAGWGRTRLGPENKAHSYLIKTYLSLLTKEECQQIYFIYELDDAFCLRGNSGGPTYGDSGSGIYYKGLLVGLVAHGKNNGTSQYPAVYTNVLYHKAWIERTMTALSSMQCDQRRSVWQMHDLPSK